VKGGREGGREGGVHNMESLPCETKNVRGSVSETVAVDKGGCSKDRCTYGCGDD
jgi:hypothetical protein